MRRRLEMMQDILAILADGEMADARAVIDVLAHLSTWELLPKLWHQVKAPDAPTVDEDAS